MKIKSLVPYVSFFLGFIVCAVMQLHSKPNINPEPVKIETEQISSQDERFKLAMVTVLRHEGGLSDNKSDPGGITKYGISLRYLKSANMDIDGDGDVDQDDIIHLTQTEADNIYYKEWFKKYRYGDIKDQAVMTDILDFSINAGAKQCHKVVQRAINSISSKQIKVDGVLGEESMSLINSLNSQKLHLAINYQQKDFYRSIVKRNPSLSIFLKGWEKRADE